jgi:hypothetical protein
MSADTSAGTVDVSHYDANGTWLIALEGDHDLSTTPLLEQQTSSVWPLCTIAVVDLSKATFIDCSVINWLLRTCDAPAAGHRVLRIVQGPPESAAARMCSLLSLRDRLAWYPTRQAALAEVAADDPDLAA